MTDVKYDSKMVRFLMERGIDMTCQEHEAYKLKSDGFMDLVVETWVEGPLLVMSICHYGQMNGDLMRDPEVVLFVDRNTGIVTPALFRNDYVQSYSECSKIVDGVLLKNEKACADTANFAETWAGNLRVQGHKLANPRNG